MATESSRSSSSSADSYIGSLISLTSKSEIRYEGILYNINTEESSIGLTNVRSFGTEGRKKDGPQIMPNDNVYEYILFRGSDIKDLQVKSSQPVQPINSDPAIIQSHYPQAATTTSSLPTAASNSSSSPSINNAHLGNPGSSFQSGLPLYQPDGNVGSWGPLPPPPNTNTGGLTMPMYWPGYYTPPNALPQLQQQPLPRPPQGLGLQQPMQYSSFNASLSSGPPNTCTPNLAEYSSPLLSTSTSSATSTSNSLPPNTSVGGAPSLVTPAQLLQSVPAAVVSTQAVHNDVEVVPVPAEAQPPLLPLPPQAHVTSKAPSYRGGERGRGSGGSRPVIKFTEEFDFNAMNEKFNKDEVWGSLGKSTRSGSKEKDGNATDEDESEKKDDPNLRKVDVKPVYSKDDFFDTLSCNSLERQSNNGRTRFSEQMKLDTETFGEFSRYRGGGRGGRGPYRGGRFRGGGYYGRGYGYRGRGRGVGNPNPNP